jgi:hypothetical protein
VVLKIILDLDKIVIRCLTFLIKQIITGSGEGSVQNIYGSGGQKPDVSGGSGTQLPPYLIPVASKIEMMINLKIKKHISC